jgi:putative Holliday junction resolvase
MRYLGLDLGTRTLGISYSEGIIASSIKTIRYTEEEKLLNDLKEVIDFYKADILVLGLPKNMDNTIGPRALETLKFKEKLESLGYKVEMQDERLSTVSAHNYMIEADMSRKKRKQKVDALAATIILQTYLERRK